MVKDVFHADGQIEVGILWAEILVGARAPKHKTWDACSTIGAFLNGVGVVSKLRGRVFTVEVKSLTTGAIIHAHRTFMFG